MQRNNYFYINLIAVIIMAVGLIVYFMGYREYGVYITAPGAILYLFGKIQSKRNIRKQN